MTAPSSPHSDEIALLNKRIEAEQRMRDSAESRARIAEDNALGWRARAAALEADLKEARTREPENASLRQQVKQLQEALALADRYFREDHYDERSEPRRTIRAALSEISSLRNDTPEPEGGV